MKSILRMAVLAVLTVSASAVAFADVLVMNDGSTKKVFNVEATQKYIYYTLTEAADDIQRIPVGEVFAYKIGDGPMTPVGQAQVNAPQQTNPTEQPATKVTGEIKPVPSEDNGQLIYRYNGHEPLVYKDKKPQPDKYTGYFMSLWGMEDSSVLSDSVVKIGFEHIYLDGNKDHSIIGHRLKVTNKTDKPLYIDLANSFRKMNGGYMEPFYKGSVYSEGAASTSGGSLNMGAVAGALGVGGALGTLASGLNVGQANTKTAGITTAEQQYLIVPAHSSVTMPGRKVSNGKTILETYEPLFFCQKTYGESVEKYALKNSDLTTLTVTEDQKAQKVKDDQDVSRESLEIRRWVQTDYTPETTPKKLGYIITYSTEPDFSAYTRLPVDMYMRGAFGFNVNGSYYFYYNSTTYDFTSDLDYMITGGGHVGKGN